MPVPQHVGNVTTVRHELVWSDTWWKGGMLGPGVDWLGWEGPPGDHVMGGTRIYRPLTVSQREGWETP